MQLSLVEAGLVETLAGSVDAESTNLNTANRDVARNVATENLVVDDPSHRKHHDQRRD